MTPTTGRSRTEQTHRSPDAQMVVARRSRMLENWVWFDFENTPHVLFLEPIWRSLCAAGWEVRGTAKPQAQTLDLAAGRGLAVTKIGGGGYRTKPQKILGGLKRAAALRRWVREQGRPKLLVSSSRTASLAAWALGIRAIGLMDYEHSELRSITFACRSVWFPDVLRDVPLPRYARRVARYYPGLKENLYLDSWEANRHRARAELGVAPTDYVVVARPPADTAHYATPRSDGLFYATLDALSERSEVRVLVTPRSSEQGQDVLERTGGARVQVLERTVPGPALVGAADLVLGGGGTMNREAAVLGVPVWSTFAGLTPHIDDVLASEGRLRWIRSEEEGRAAAKGPLPGRGEPRRPYPQGLEAIMGDVRSCLAD